MIRATLSSGDVNVGDTLPSFDKTFTAADLMAYGAATWDWHRVHYDLVRAKEFSFPNVFVDGQTYGSIFARHAMDWFGPKAFIKKMSVRYRTMVFAGESIKGKGEVVDIQVAGEHAVVVISQVLMKGDSVVAACRTEAHLPH
jgi:acyl dehydratase